MRTRISRAHKPDLSAEDRALFETALKNVRVVLKGVPLNSMATIGWWKHGRAVRQLLRGSVAMFKLTTGRKKIGISVFSDGSITIAGMPVSNSEDADRILMENGI